MIYLTKKLQSVTLIINNNTNNNNNKFYLVICTKKNNYKYCTFEWNYLSTYKN